MVLDPALLEPEAPRPLRRSEYDELVAAGAFDDERVELLHGVIVTMSPNDPPHASPIESLTEIFVRALAGRARVRVQLPLVAAGESEPEPDVACVPPGNYSRAHPDRALLVVEVAYSSLRKDRLVKAPLYAASGFAEYWIVDVRAGAFEVYRDPAAGAWREVTRHGRGEVLRPLAFPDVAVPVSEVLGSP